MKKTVFAAVSGFLQGIAVQYIVAFVVSMKLRLGYFMPCIATLPEAVGGEMTAIIVQATVCGWAGASVALAVRWGQMAAWPPRKRAVAVVVTLLAGLAPALVLLRFSTRGLL